MLADALDLRADDRDALWRAVPLPIPRKHLLPRDGALVLDGVSEIDEIANRLVQGARLITVTGPAGTGKTRVAVAAARTLSARGHLAVRWLPVVVGTAEVQLTAALAAAVGIVQPPEVSIESVAEALRGAPLLLVIDQAEAALAAVAAAADTLLAKTTQLSIIVTSRQPLELPSEVLLRLGPQRQDDGYRSLTPAGQVLLARLSVFANPFDLPSAAAVCGSGWSVTEVADTLSLLAATSLVVGADDADRITSFRLPSVIRTSAAERLNDQPDCFEVHRRYADWIRDFAALTASHLRDRDQHLWSARLDARADDLRRAFTWQLGHDIDSALEMVGSLGPWWHRRGLYQEGRSWTASALERSVHTPAARRAPALAVAGLLALAQGNYEVAQSRIQRGLDAFSNDDNKPGVRWSLALLGVVALERGEYTVAAQLHERSLVLARRAKDLHAAGEQLNSLSSLAWLRRDFQRAEEIGQHALELMSRLGDQQGIASALFNLGVTAHYRQDPAGARILLTHSLELSERIGWREAMACAHHRLGALSRTQGDHGTAETHLTASLAEFRRLGSRWRNASVLDELAALAVATGDPEQAMACLGAAAQLRREIGAALPLAEQSSHDQTVAQARALLGPAAQSRSRAGLAPSAC